MATYNKRGYKSPKPEIEESIESEFDEVVATGESTTADVFNTLDKTASRTEDCVAKNHKVIVETKEQEAMSVVFQSQEFFNDAISNPATADSLFKLALNGAEGKLGFVGVTEEFSGTKTGNLANYYAGMSYMHLKDFKNAE